MTATGPTKLIFLLLATAGAAAMLNTSAALANTAVEFDHEPGGVNCAPCSVVASGESHMNAFGIRVSTCSDLFNAEIHHNGTGHVGYFNTQHDSGGSCTRIACNGVGESAFESEFDIQSSEETVSKAGEMNVRFCLDAASNPNGTGTHCTAPVRFIQTTTHNYVFNLHAQCTGGIIEVEGTWAQTGGHQLEVVHIH